eukprot:COSAG01_NODE_33251_length_567_cov_1.217949_2_plen_122_part_01
MGRCLADIDGGMNVDIYDSMATGVQNAACVIPFMTEKYAASENCALELKFAKEMGVPIVPVMMQSKRADGSPWKASGWLYAPLTCTRSRSKIIHYVCSCRHGACEPALTLCRAQCTADSSLR